MLPAANIVIGQPAYTTDVANNGGISAVSLSSPIGAVATNGTQFYIADTANHRILGYGSPPISIAGAATILIGQSSYSDASSGTAPTVGGPIKLNSPTKVSIADTGSALAVADTANNRVLIWNSLPTSNTAPDVVVGQPSLSTAVANYPSGSPSASSLDAPTAAVIAGGRLFVADTANNRVLIWNSVPQANGLPADLVLGQTNFTSNVQGIDTFNSSTGSYTMMMTQPSDVWSNGMLLLIVDQGNSRVLVWSAIPASNNQLAGYLIGQPVYGQNLRQTGPQNFSSPFGVASDGLNVFVSDTANNRVLEFQNYFRNPSTYPVANYVFGQINFVYGAYNDPEQNGLSGASPTAGTFHSPQGLFVDAGQLYVTDSSNNRVLGFSDSSGATGTQAVSEPRP